MKHLTQRVAWHDNRETNPANPDYRQFITWGDRTVDEMAHAWVGITYLTQEDFEAQVEAQVLG